ncbi:MAG: hypothetical protein ACOC22_00230 [bacterium]
MANKYTVYFTYMLEDDASIKSDDKAYSTPIHCNYINKFSAEDLSGEVNLYFDNENDFQFLSTNNGGTGFTANRIHMLVQVVTNELVDDGDDEYEELEPKSHRWRKFDVTHQIDGHVSGDTLTASGLTSTVFKTSLINFNASGVSYDLDYLNYPGVNDNTSLNFGDEEFFLGNVETEIEASVYTTDLAINLPLNQFNSTTNPTWDGESEVYITEIGIYNEERELIAIGKLNNPLKKDSSISRTIVFGIDF